MSIIPGIEKDHKEEVREELELKQESAEHISGEQEKHQKIFDRVAIWELDGPTKEQVADKVVDDLNTGIGYWSQMLLAAVIATLGLLTNSTAVVIGAMLIAPILRPIQGLAFSTSTGSHTMFMKSLLLLLASVAGGVLVGAVITWMIPFAQITPEILIRTQPTLLDLFIAMASGMIAFLSLGHKKIASGLAGVAMAAALLPPLAVIGIGIALMDSSIARGSLILFATNLIAIVIVGLAVLFLFGFSPNAKKNYRTSQRRVVLIILLLAALIVPLMKSFTSVSKDIETKTTIATSTRNYLQTIDPRIHLTTSSYSISPQRGMQVALDLQVPQSIILTQDEKLELTQLLASQLDASVSLQFTITPTVAVQKPIEHKPTQGEVIDKIVVAHLQKIDKKISYITSTYLKSTKAYVLTLYANEEIDTDNHEEDIRKVLKGQNIKTIVIDWRQEKTTPTKEEQTTLDEKLVDLRQSFQLIVGDDIILENIVYSEKVPQIDLKVISYETKKETYEKMKMRQENVEKTYSWSGVVLNIDMQRRERVQLTNKKSP